MSDNRTFWVKYREYRPVQIESHIDPNRTDRKHPLLNVAHLIEAYQSRRGSSLANVDSGLISVHIGNNNDLIIGDISEPALPGSTLLNSLTAGITEDTPLIIRMNQNLTSNEEIGIETLILDMDVDNRGTVNKLVNSDTGDKGTKNT